MLVGTFRTVRSSGSVEISEAVKAATSAVGVLDEKHACQSGSFGCPPQYRHSGPLELLALYRCRTPPTLRGEEDLCAIGLHVVAPATGEHGGICLVRGAAETE